MRPIADLPFHLRPPPRLAADATRAKSDEMRFELREKPYFSDFVRIKTGRFSPQVLHWCGQKSANKPSVKMDAMMVDGDDSTGEWESIRWQELQKTRLTLRTFVTIVVMFGPELTSR